MDIRESDATLDLRGVICPMNFQKTKLKLESMGTGQLLEILLDTGEPFQNVPKGLDDEGHKIVAIVREEDFCTLKVRKR